MRRPSKTELCGSFHPGIDLPFHPKFVQLLRRLPKHDNFRPRMSRNLQAAANFRPQMSKDANPRNSQATKVRKQLASKYITIFHSF